MEETGLDLRAEGSLIGQVEEEGACRVLGLWESMYPPVLYMGAPRRHHLVVYLHLKLHSISSTHLQHHIKVWLGYRRNTKSHDDLAYHHDLGVRYVSITVILGGMGLGLGITVVYE